MTIERARVVVWPKPWGVADVRPWSDADDGAGLIGELSYERADDTAPAAALLLKLLFTNAALSIQVHPDDAYARSLGLPHGKSEAWYVLSAAPGAQVALGLKEPTTRERLRCAIVDGSIAALVDWRPIEAHDTISVPAGVIHAIGAGLVIAEIQQRSDATFRLFDHGRMRALHVDDATAMADLDLPESQPRSERLSTERTVLAANSHFVFEHIVLAPGSRWCLDAARETWLLVLDGIASAGAFDLVQGGAIFAEGERVELRVGRSGVKCLVATTGDRGPAPQLLEPIAFESTLGALHLGQAQAPTPSIGAGL